MPKGRDQGYTAQKKERFVKTKQMINDEEGLGKILKHSGMFIVLIVWNVAEAFTRFIPSAIWVFIISGLLDALVNCLVVIFATKMRGKNAWIWAAIISGWNILSLLSHMLPINLWILIDIIIDVIINILFLIFAPMIIFYKSDFELIPNANENSLSSVRQADKSVSAVSPVKPESTSVKRPPVAARSDSILDVKTSSKITSEANRITDSVSENPLERDALKVVADMAQTNRILAEQLQKQSGGEKNAKLDGGNGGEKNAG